MDWLLVLWLWLADGGFHDAVTCRVEAYVYVAPGEKVDVSRHEFCRGEVRAAVSGRGRIVLWSDRVKVEIPLHDGLIGFVRLTYDWGRASAHVGAETVPVAASPIVAG